MPERIDFWGIPYPWGPALIYGILTLAVLVAAARFYLQLRPVLRAARRARRWDQPHRRLWRVVEQGLLQTRSLRQRYPGIMHLALSLTFALFFLGTVLATIHSRVYPILRGSPYLVYKLVLDLASLAFLAGAGMALYRRLVMKPARLTLTPPFLVTLGLLALIVANGLALTGLRLAVQQPEWAAWTPSSWLIARALLLSGLGEPALRGLHLGFYVFHLASVVAFFVTLPNTSAAHMLTAPLNIFFSDLERDGARLHDLPLAADGDALVALTPRQLGWKALLDAEACTECGRCQAVCPAFAAGLPLDPKALVLDVREAARAGGSGNPLAGGAIAAETIWACMACGACMDACPVLVEHVDLVVELRRSLVERGQVEPVLQKALTSAAHFGNTESQPPRQRAHWTRLLKTPLKDARREPVEYLWLVGDTLGLTPELEGTAAATAEVFQAAGLDVGILYEDEISDGNDVRRAGEEGLFQALMRRGSHALRERQFQAVITTDPHTCNTLRNEYPPEVLAGRRVLHAAELLDELLSQGRLSVRAPLGLRVTYHDPCYLGRFNGVYEAPRRVLAAIGCEVVEMAHCRGESICCGAGGGRLWMSEGAMRQRPAERRMDEARALEGVRHFVVACPKDRIMYADAAGEEMEVVDLVELVRAALPG